jgi:3-oxoacyl-[acyl-carrier protein] reductase
MDVATGTEEVRRIAVITGASRGIGAAIAHRLASDGARPILVARDAQRLGQLAEELAAAEPVVVPTDLSSREAIDALIAFVSERFGRVDILINNAGVLPRAQRVERIAHEDWEKVVALNLTAPWHLSAGLAGLMPRGSVVVNLSSTAAFYPSRGLAAYNVSKAALVMLTRCCALEWAARGVRVVGIAPGKVSTEMVAPILEYLDTHGEAVNPLGRVAEPEEVASLVSYLVSEAATFVTGAVFPIDGGELCGIAASGG